VPRLFRRLRGRATLSEIHLLHVHQLIQRLSNFPFVPLVQSERDRSVAGQKIERLDYSTSNRRSVIQRHDILRRPRRIGLPTVFLDVAAALLEMPFLLIALPDDLGLDRSNRRKRHVLVFALLGDPDPHRLALRVGDQSVNLLPVAHQHGPLARPVGCLRIKRRSRSSRRPRITAGRLRGRGVRLRQQKIQIALRGLGCRAGGKQPDGQRGKCKRIFANWHSLGSFDKV